jgi:hypothetical protein
VKIAIKVASNLTSFFQELTTSPTVNFGSLFEQAKDVCDGHRDSSKGWKGETFGVLLEDVADTGDLLSSGYLTALIQGRIVRMELNERGRRAAEVYMVWR